MDSGSYYIAWAGVELIVLSTLASDTEYFSCLCFLIAGIMDVHNHAWQEKKNPNFKTFFAFICLTVVCVYVWVWRSEDLALTFSYVGSGFVLTFWTSCCPPQPFF